MTIPNSVTSIGPSAFSYCSSLTSVYITDIAAWCKISFSDYYSNPLSYAHNLYLNNELVTELIIPDGVTNIGTSAFSGCSSLTSITVDENNQTYKSIDGNLYTKDGTNLIKYAIGKRATTFSIPDSVTKISSYAFAYCSSLTGVTIPNSVTSIGSYAFIGCSSLTIVTIGNNVASIGDYAFRNCSSLTSVTIPDNVTSIGDLAFSSCSSLASVTIGSGVTSIGERAFIGCSSLTSITIPNSVTSFGDYAFKNCTRLKSITYKGTKTQWGKIIKGYQWNSGLGYNAGYCTVKCTDGNLETNYE